MEERLRRLQRRRFLPLVPEATQVRYPDCYRCDRRDRVPARAGEMGVQLRRRLTEVMGRRPIIGDVRGLGLMTALDLVTSRATRPPAAEVPPCA